MADLIPHIEDNGADGGDEPIERPRRTALRMMYASNADVVSESTVGLTKI